MNNHPDRFGNWKNIFWYKVDSLANDYRYMRYASDGNKKKHKKYQKLRSCKHSSKMQFIRRFVTYLVFKYKFINRPH